MPLLVGAFSVGGIYLGGRWQRGYAREERRAVQHEARIARFAQVLGPITTLLMESNPARFVTGTPELVEQYRQRWLRLLEQLETVAVAEPSREMRGLIDGWRS